MNPDELISGNTTVDTNSLLPNLSSSMTDMLGPIIWLSMALTIVFVVLYGMSILRRRKLENTLLDMHKILQEMNERDKARSAPATPARVEKIPEKEILIARPDRPQND